MYHQKELEYILFFHQIDDIFSPLYGMFLNLIYQP